MSRLIPDSYMYRAIGAEINGACGKCELSRSDCMCQSLSRMDVCGIIDDAPTVDDVQVVHGEWIWEEDVICSPRTCSVCKHKFYIGRGWNFCPNCGARMDGKEK